MKFHGSWVLAAAGGIIALVVVSVLVDDPTTRALLSILAMVPLLWVTVRIALGTQRRLTEERRRFNRLRNATDEFVINVRNLNRVVLSARTDEPPDDLEMMLEDIVGRMHQLVERIREAAGEEDPEG